VTRAAVHLSQFEHQDLRRFLKALRLQLWWRDALTISAASILLGALLGVVALLWPNRTAWSDSGALVVAWTMLVGLAIGALLSTLRRPTLFRAARVADRQLSTASRLATASEVLDGRLSGDLAPAQLDDAWRLASGIHPWHAYPQTWRMVQAALAALAASVALLALALGGVLAPLDVPGFVGPFGDQGSQMSDTDASQATDASAADAAIPPDPSNNPAAAAQTIEELQAAAAQSQANEAALQKLADALRGTAAAADVGNALRRGDYDDAAAKLATLGRDSDQLSRVSKRELANAMQRVAFDTAKLDPPLALAEDAVQRALNRQVYTETKAALENLAKTVTDTKNGVVSQEALAKSLDQLQQSQAPTPGGGAGDSADYIPDIPGTEPNQVGLVKGAPSTISVPGPEGDPATATRSGTGQNPGGDPLGDLTSRLNLPPTDVSVDTALANDKGRQTANPAAPTVKISDTNQNGVRPSSVPQPGDPVQDVAEQSIEPTAERDSVRAFFKTAGDTPPSQIP
jgi:hypothetical protein